MDLIHGDAELQLTIQEGNQIQGIEVNGRVDEVYELFIKYKHSGLDNSFKKNSPVHQGPLNQTWVRGNFMFTDPSGNTLHFVKVID
ncbi:MAG: hypothetical protein ABIR66_11280 [Saprospiraceae bacterium]